MNTLRIAALEAVIEGKNIVIYDDVWDKIYILDDIISAVLIDSKSCAEINEIVNNSDIIAINNDYIYTEQRRKCVKVHMSSTVFDVRKKRCRYEHSCTCVVCEYMKCVDRYRC